MSLAVNLLRCARVSVEKHQFLSACAQTYLCKRERKLWQSQYTKEVYWRRLDAGPEPERHRSAWKNWNYESEIYGFGKRLGEEFKETTLRRAFTHSCYVAREQEKRSELELDGVEIQDNEELIATGSEVSESYIKTYLRHVYPAFPEQGISAVCDWLLSDEVLAHVSSNIGTKDLILTPEFPVSQSKLSRTLLAVVGALVEDQGVERAELFVQDFVISQLIGQDINELWTVVNPMGLLCDTLQSQGREPPEPRLLWSAGSETLVAVYQVGIYSDKQLIGKGFGESVSIAEEMAARDSLRELYSTTLSSAPLPLGTEGRKLNLDHDRLSH